MRRLTDAEVLAARFYTYMPGAPPPPMDDGIVLWGEVDNDHWRFCAAIAYELAELRSYVMATRSSLQ